MMNNSKDVKPEPETKDLRLDPNEPYYKAGKGEGLKSDLAKVMKDQVDFFTRMGVLGGSVYDLEEWELRLLMKVYRPVRPLIKLVRSFWERVYEKINTLSANDRIRLVDCQYDINKLGQIKFLEVWVIFDDGSMVSSDNITFSLRNKKPLQVGDELIVSDENNSIRTGVIEVIDVEVKCIGDEFEYGYYDYIKGVGDFKLLIYPGKIVWCKKPNHNELEAI